MVRVTHPRGAAAESRSPVEHLPAWQFHRQDVFLHALPITPSLQLSPCYILKNQEALTNVSGFLVPSDHQPLIYALSTGEERGRGNFTCSPILSGLRGPPSNSWAYDMWLRNPQTSSSDLGPWEGATGGSLGQNLALSGCPPIGNVFLWVWVSLYGKLRSRY